MLRFFFTARIGAYLNHEVRSKGSKGATLSNPVFNQVLYAQKRNLTTEIFENKPNKYFQAAHVRKDSSVFKELQLLEGSLGEFSQSDLKDKYISMLVRCPSENIDEVSEIFNSCQKLYDIAITKWLDSGNLDVAVSYFIDMVEFRVDPSAEVVQALINLYSEKISRLTKEESTIDTAVNLVDEIQDMMMLKEEGLQTRQTWVTDSHIESISKLYAVVLVNCSKFVLLHKTKEREVQEKIRKVSSEVRNRKTKQRATPLEADPFYAIMMAPKKRRSRLQLLYQAWYRRVQQNARKKTNAYLCCAPQKNVRVSLPLRFRQLVTTCW